MTRKQHVEWAKQRALEYVDQGDIQGAMSSIASDLKKHPETEAHSAITLGMMLLAGGSLNTPVQMRKFIEGFQ